MLENSRGLEMRGHDRHIILPQRAYRFSITERRFKELRLRIEDDMKVEMEPALKTLRALVPIERRRVRLSILRRIIEWHYVSLDSLDRRRADAPSRPTRYHIVHRRSARWSISRSPFARARLGAGS